MHKLFSCPPVQNQYVPPVFSPFRRSLTRFLLIAGCLVILAFSSTLPALAQSRTSHAGAGDTVGNNAEEDLDAVLEYMQDLYLLGLIDGEPLDDEHPLNPRYGPLREQPQVYGPFLPEEDHDLEHTPVHNPIHSLPRGSACERCSHNEPKPERGPLLPPKPPGQHVGPQGFIDLGPIRLRPLPLDVWGPNVHDPELLRLPDEYGGSWLDPRCRACRVKNVVDSCPDCRAEKRDEKERNDKKSLEQWLEAHREGSCMNTRHIITEICDPTKPCRYEYDPFDDRRGEVVP